MITLQPNEILIKQDKVLRIYSALKAKPGKLYLTNQRVVFQQNHFLTMALGLIGLLLTNVLNGKTFSILRNQVTSFMPGNHGANKNVLIVQIKEEQWKFVLTDTLAAWQSALQK